MAVRIPQPQDTPEPTGRLAGNTVVANGLTASAPDFVARATELGDASAIGRLCQEAFDIGVTAWRTVQVDSELRRAADVMERFETTIEDATTRAVESVQAEMDAIARPDDGLIAGAVTREMAKLSEALEAAFAQEDKNSVLSKVEQAVTAATEQVVAGAYAKMQRLVDPSAEESPMGRLVHEITLRIGPGLNDVTNNVKELREFLKVTAAVAKEREKGHEKGRSYEDLVEEALSAIALITGDTVERVADAAGATGGAKVGDFVVVADRPTGPVRIVFEAKDVTGMSGRRVREELNEAAENRQASVAVMVFAVPTGGGNQMPLAKLAAGRYTVVYDKATLDDLALRVAYQLARYEALAVPGAEAVIDLQELGGRLAEARRILDQITEVKKGHGQITSGLKLAAEQVDRLQRDLGAALDGIVEYIARGGTVAPPDAAAE